MNNFLKLNNLFIYLFLILFPFGQVIRFGIIQPIDVIVILSAIYTIFVKLPQPSVFKHVKDFLFVATFSWLLNIFVIYTTDVLYGFLYLIRLVSYTYFAVYVWNFAREKINRKFLILSLLSVSVVSTVFGWIQLIVFPDLKPLFIWGWDMHLYRLVGTFYDPTYLGLIIVFGLLVFIYQPALLRKALLAGRFIKLKKLSYYLMIVFLLISLAFTYSRASYLAFFAGFLIISFYKKTFKQFVIIGICLIFLILVLPTARNHSIQLFRSFSAISRIENYGSTLTIYSKSPVFGVGYNNMCTAYNKFIGYQKYSSHACSGSDSSLLFIIATTGVLGLISFIFCLSKINTILRNNSDYLLFSASLVALLIHSLFSNSMFYPWTMGWILILTSTLLAED